MPANHSTDVSPALVVSIQCHGFFRALGELSDTVWWLEAKNMAGKRFEKGKTFSAFQIYQVIDGRCYCTIVKHEQR